MEFVVNIGDFEGPLDLMLHLIREKELDLFNLDVNVLTDQYVAFIHQQEKLHLEIAGEYLTELAGLIEIKSKSLLPQKPKVDSEDQEDPKEKLIRRLIEYQKFKDVAKILDDYQNERVKQYSKPVSTPTKEQEIDFDNKYLEGNPYDLMKAMNRALRHLALTQTKETVYRPKEYLISEIEDEIKEKYGHIKEKMTLESMIVDCESLMKAVSIFLAILDLIHQGKMIFTCKKDVVYLMWSNEDGK